MSTKELKKDIINNIFHLTLEEQTDLLGAVRFHIFVTKDGRILNEQFLESLEVALSIYDGMHLFYEKVIKE